MINGKSSFIYLFTKNVLCTLAVEYHVKDFISAYYIVNKIHCLLEPQTVNMLVCRRDSMKEDDEKM